MVSDHCSSVSSEKHLSSHTGKEDMYEYIYRFRSFKGLHSDQGANVVGAVFKGLCDLIDAVKTRTAPYCPQGDGQVERLNKSLAKILSKLISDQHWDWEDFVPKAVLAYKTSVHELTYLPLTA